MGTAIYTEYRRYFEGAYMGISLFSRSDAGMRGQSKFTEEDAQAWISRWNREGKPIWRYELVEPVPQRDEAL